MPLDSTHKEKELLQRLASGDTEALASWYDLYYTSLVFFSKSIINNQQEAEDIAQECFVKLWQQRTKIGSEQKLRGYLFTIARNACLDHLKHRHVRENVHQQLLEQGSSNAFIEANIVAADLLKIIYSQIDELPMAYRDLVKMLYLEELSSAEVAERLNITMDNLRQRKARALHQLKNLLLKKGMDRVIIFLSLVSRFSI